MFCLVGLDSFYQLAVSRLNAAFEEIGLPYSIFKADQSFDAVVSRSDFGGAYFAFNPLQDRRKCQTLSPAATEIGIVDAVSVTNNLGEEISYGDNIVWTAIKACMEKGGIKYSETTTILIIGADYSARAACHAVQSLGFQTIVIVR
jgi:shikimate 5-dehydrogenase